MNNHRLIQDICSSYDWIDSYSIHGALQIVLSHNDEPTSIQATSVASSKEHIDLAHQRITDDIDNLENALDLLRTRQYDLKRLSVKHAGALSKRRQLPNEILSEIFLHACCDDPVRVGGRGWRNEGPWQLRKVCRKWASIVEGCSQLWSRMSVNVTYKGVDPAGFSQALQFCGLRHIDMKLNLHKNSARWFSDSFDTELDTIASSSSRWETLEIKGDEQLLHLVQKLFPRLDQQLPVLRSLKLQGRQCHPNPSSPTQLSALLTAPLLENLHLDLHTPEIVSELLDILPIPCRQIRRLLCQSNKYELDAWHVPLSLSKENFPLLERCMITSFDRDPTTSNHISASDRIEHDGVVHFTTSQEDMLDVFRFPSLRTLLIGKSDDGDAEVPFFDDNTSGMVFKRASQMLLASRCSLVSLVLSYSFTLVDEFLKVLDVVPTLELLDMSVGWSPEGRARDDVLSKIFTTLGSRTNTTAFSLLPALRDLRLSIAAPYCRFTASGIRAYGPWRKPLQRCNLRFVSQALDAMTERFKCPSNFRIFSFALFSDRPARWRLLKSEIDQLRAHKMIRFSTNNELHLVESFESVDDEDDGTDSPPVDDDPWDDDEIFYDPYNL